jgi:hypothetical protein
MAGVAACGIEDPTNIFVWSLTPTEAETAIGQLVSFQIRIDTKSNINNDVELEPGAVPDGFTVSLPTGMTSTQQTADGTVYASPAVEEGTYEVEIRAREAGGEFTARQIRVTVTNAGGSADFSVEVDPQTFTMEIELGKTFTYYVRPLNGFTGTVAVTITGLTDDLVFGQVLTPSTLDFPPGSGGKGGTFVLRYLPQPPVASPVQLVVTAQSGTIVHTRTITLTLVPRPAARPDPRVRANPGTVGRHAGRRTAGPPS